MEIFKFNDYRSFVKAQIDSQNASYGYKTRLASAARMSRSHLSSLLQERVEITPDQAVAFAEFWALSELEKDYFMNLVMLARSATPVLKNYYRQKLKRMRQQSEHLLSRFQSNEENLEAMDATKVPEQAHMYYSSWHFMAVHMLLCVKEYQTVRALSRRLNLSEERVTFVLSNLQKIGLATINPSGDWKPTNKNLHIPKDSLHAKLNHSNWRLKTIEAMNLASDSGGVHYTSVNALSRELYEELKQLLIHFIEQSRERILPSAEEEVVCFNCDMFVL